MKFINQTALSKSNKTDILNIWNNEYPEKLNYQTLSEFEQYLENLTEKSHVLMIGKNEEIKGWYVDFIRDNEKWFVLLIDSEFHGKGLGTMILSLAKQKESELNGWVIENNNDKKKNGAYYTSPINFYLKNGFKKVNKTRLALENIAAVKIKWMKT